MAVIKNIEFLLDGVKHKYKVSCSSLGDFSFDLPYLLQQKLRIKSENLKGRNLALIEREFWSRLTEYKEGTRIDEPFILILFKAYGSFAYNLEGERFQDRFFSSRGMANLDGLELDYQFYIRETMSGECVMFKASMDDKGIFHKSFAQDPSNYGVLVPYSDEALNALVLAKRRLQEIAVGLHSFLTKDTDIISEALNAGPSLTRLIA